MGEGDRGGRLTMAVARVGIPDPCRGPFTSVSVPFSANGNGKCFFGSDESVLIKGDVGGRLSDYSNETVLVER